MTAGRPQIYKDDKLVSKCFRLSIKHELKYVAKFILILRKYRQQAIDFVERFKNGN